MDNWQYSLIRGYASLLNTIQNFQNSIENSPNIGMSVDTSFSSETASEDTIGENSLVNFIFIAFLLGLILNYFINGLFNGKRKRSPNSGTFSGSKVDGTTFINKDDRKDDDFNSPTL